MSKTKKIILFIISFSVCISLLTVSAFAESYNFPDTTILTENTALHISNGKDYSQTYLPNAYLDHNENDGSANDKHGENYAMALYDVNYNPPTGGTYDNYTTCVYLRLRELEGIKVSKGKRLRIDFKLKYSGFIDFDLLTTRVAVKGWSTSLRKNVGYLPRDSVTECSVYWDNTSNTDFKIDYFDINFLLYNNQSINSDWIFWFFYDSLKVTVEDIPITNQDIIDNQDENTDKVIQSQKDQYEQEKQETENAGNDSVDSLLGAIPGDTDGLLNSFGNLINCMTTTEQKTKFSFGSLKTPSIMGIPSYTLVEDISLDLGRYEKENPTFKTILILVRALLTIALIIYCFKELYSTIQYVLTLRKGDGT